jgi:AcrR family transcriptional regulator
MAATRRHGRELLRAIHEAVLAEIAEHGYAGTTYDRIANRAGTGKPVLYRRWPAKAGMVLDALVAAAPAPVVPADTGSLAADLKAFLRTVQATIEGSGRRTVLSLLAELDSPAVAALRELLFVRGAELVEPLLDRARRRGELGGAALPPRIALLALDLVRHEVTLVGALTAETLDVIVDEIAVPLLVSRSSAGERP